MRNPLADRPRFVLPALAWLLALTVANSALADDAVRSDRVSFNEQIRPIFAAHCVACHGGVKQASGVSFIYRDKALAEGDSGVPSIVPGDVDASYLVERIADPDPDYRMPPAEHGPPLTKDEIELVKQWIAEGAKWDEHWSFVAPKRHEPPLVRDASWSKSKIDPFVLAQLERESLTPSAEASRSEWLRRVSFDLIGLPPTADERAAFLADRSDDAYERVVDRLLASPHYGERWAAMWLDLARYADTMGYEKDPHRDMWPYRDWLIRALNDDMPYDAFIVKQLAGDLLPDATMADRVATAFHRNTQTNTEGGTDDEEFRTAAVLDRVNTTWQALAGTTFGCCQCHSHPYDPIEHDEYYQFVAVFNNTRDADLDEESPKLAVPKHVDDWPRAATLDRQIRECRTAVHQQLAPLAIDQTSWRYLEFASGSSTGETQIVTTPPTEGQPPEFTTEGTVTTGSIVTLETTPADASSTVTALRIESLPRDLQAALKQPEPGFVVTRLRVSVEDPAAGESRPVSFGLAICDEPLPVLDPVDSLKDNSSGWGVHPKIDRPHWAVFVPVEPVEVPQGGYLKVVLKHNRQLGGELPLVTDRGRLAVSNDPHWQSIPATDTFRDWQQQLAQVTAARAAIDSTLLPVMEEIPSEQRRWTFEFNRGNWLDKGDRVRPGVPAVFAQPESTTAVDRLAVAQWFASPDHPLTARVMVNRLWEQLFGVGIVETIGDFGTSGTPPSHPLLLDDLAVRFSTDMQWSIKQLLRELVLSSTYRQRSQVSDELAHRDPRNRLLARGPRLRLTAEMVRDQALVLSGLFSPKMFGPSVMPPQPDGIWRSVYSGARWTTAAGDDRYRRAVYTYWKRTSPYPAMVMFDAPSRELCSVQRIATNTPLQPLVTMNDPVFVECAQGLAARMAAEGGSTPAEQIAWALALATGDESSPEALATLVALFDDARAAYSPDNADMQTLGADADAYARTVVASTILNLDSVVTR